MSFRVLLVLLFITAVAVQGKELDAGPQTFTNTNSSASDQKPQKRFATKEIILYLTPTQIKALESGKAELNTQSTGQITITNLQNTERPATQNLQLRYNNHLENLDILKAPAIQDLLDNRQQQQQQQQQQQGYRYFKLTDITPENKAQQQQPEVQFFNPEVQNSKQPRLSQFIRVQNEVRNEWNPIIPVTEKNAESSVQEQYNAWRNSFGANNDQNKNNEQRGESQNSGNQASNFNRQSSGLQQQENGFRSQDYENQRALAQAEAIANSPPIVIHKEVQITKHKAVPVLKHVNVPTPVLVPIIHPYEVKVPQPYPVPVEIIKHVPVPILRNEKSEGERNTNYDLNNRYAPAKNVYINVDSPSLQVWRH